MVAWCIVAFAVGIAVGVIGTFTVALCLAAREEADEEDRRIGA